MIELFWGKLHWVHHILYLPKEEGGQGLVHQSRTDDFRLQFLQRFLMGPENDQCSSEICPGDEPLVLMDPSKNGTFCLKSREHRLLILVVG